MARDDTLPPPSRGRAGEGGRTNGYPLREEHPDSRSHVKLLRSNLTEPEQRLWSHLRRRQLGGFRFRRQMPIGPFVADFACASEKLVVELDGGQHVDDAARDRSRDAWLASRGYRVLRFWNNDVMRDIDAVLAEILRHLEGGR
ncbi:MAG: endonuclease domain-containing protein [Kiloniellales bacterium]